MVMDTKETYQGVTVEDELHLPVTGPLFHLLQAFANVDVVVNQIRANVGRRNTRKGSPIRPLASLSRTKRGDLTRKIETESRRSRLARGLGYVS